MHPDHTVCCVFQFWRPAPVPGTDDESDQPLNLATVAFGKRCHSEGDVRIGERHEKLHDGAVCAPGNVLVCSWLLLPAIKDEPRGEVELTGVQRHPATPEQSRERLLGAKAAVGIGHDFIFTAVMPPTVTDAKSPSSAEHLSGVALAAHQACSARTVNDITSGATPQGPPRMVTSAIEAKLRSFAVKEPRPQTTEKFDGRYEATIRSSHHPYIEFAPDMAREGVDLQRIGFREPVEKARRRLTRDWVYTARKASHRYLATVSTRW
ncbi:hypothetical protein [Microbacterium sp. MMO-113]|uniref:hypothetical protein n=1 Tax=unclassified Microbacterium TaxID=2609290 RepID=UPI00301AC8BD